VLLCLHIGEGLASGATEAEVGEKAPECKALQEANSGQCEYYDV